MHVRTFAEGHHMDDVFEDLFETQGKKQSSNTSHTENSHHIKQNQRSTFL